MFRERNDRTLNEHQVMISFPLLLKHMGVFIFILIHSQSLVQRSLSHAISSLFQSLRCSFLIIDNMCPQPYRVRKPQRFFSGLLHLVGVFNLFHTSQLLHLDHQLICGKQLFFHPRSSLLSLLSFCSLGSYLHMALFPLFFIDCLLPFFHPRSSLLYCHFVALGPICIWFFSPYFSLIVSFHFFILGLLCYHYCHFVALGLICIWFFSPYFSLIVYFHFFILGLLCYHYCHFVALDPICIWFFSPYFSLIFYFHFFILGFLCYHYCHFVALDPICIWFFSPYFSLTVCFNFFSSLGCVYLCSHLPYTFDGWVPILDFYIQGFSSTSGLFFFMTQQLICC